MTEYLTLHYVGFTISVLAAGVVGWLALGSIRVWWVYIVAGEMLLSVGISILFGVVGQQALGWSPAGWYFLYGISHGVTVPLLLMCLSDRLVTVVYAAAGLLAVTLGLEIIIWGVSGVGYAVLVGGGSAVKLGIVVYYWVVVLNLRVHYGSNRLHLWER